MVLSAQSANTATYQKTAWIDKALVVLMVIALSVQGPSLFALGSMDFTVGHALVGIVGALSVLRCLMARNPLTLPPVSLHILLGVYAVVTVLDAPQYGFGTMIFKYVFQYLVLVVVLNLLVLINNGKQSVRLITWGAWIVLALVLVNAISHAGAFIEYYSHPWDGHPNFATIFSGGVNLEATWPAMLGVFFDDNREGRVYLAITYVFAALVQSRAGVMLAVLALAYVILIKRDGGVLAKRIVVVVATAVFAVLFVLVGPRAISAHNAEVRAQQQAALAAATQETGPEDTSESTTPQGTPGRRGIWTGALKAIQDAPVLGVGAGNAMDVVRSLTHYPYREDNVHNYPLQVLVDFGVVGFAAFAVMAIVFLVHNIRARLMSSFGAFVVLYLIGSMIQFAGGELLVGFALAGYFAFGPNMQGGSAWVFGHGRVQKYLALDNAEAKGELDV